MINWTDEGAILAARPFGENAVIIDVFSQEHGRHAGVVRGGASRKMAPTLQPGAQVSVTWKARLDKHLGSFAVEPLRSRAAAAMGDRLALAGLNAVCGILVHVLPEREALRWEQALLDEMGFGMDLSRCAVRGVNEELIYVSPKSGRAVSREGAGEWADRMLPLTPVLAGKGDASHSDILEALGTTGFFLENRLVKSLGDRPMPAARARLLDAIGRLSLG